MRKKEEDFIRDKKSSASPENDKEMYNWKRGLIKKRRNRKSSYLGN